MGRLRVSAGVVTILLCLSLWCSPVIGGPPQIMAQAGKEVVEQGLKEEGFLPLNPPTASIQVGGLVLPGQERLGTQFKRELDELLERPKLKRENIRLGETLQLGTFKELSDRIPALKAVNISRQNECQQKPLVANELLETHLVTSGKWRRSDVKLMARIAALVRVDEEDLNGYVIVTSVVAPAVEVQQCSKAKDKEEIERAVKGLAWGYRAGIQAKSNAAVGETGLNILQLFELLGIAQDRVVTVKPVNTLPEGARIGWIDRVRLRGRDAATLSDDEYTWVGNAPLQAMDLFAGKFFFRLQQGGGSSTQALTITLSNRDQPLVLHASPGGQK